MFFTTSNTASLASGDSFRSKASAPSEMITSRALRRSPPDRGVCVGSARTEARNARPARMMDELRVNPEQEVRCS